MQKNLTGPGSGKLRQRTLKASTSRFAHSYGRATRLSGRAGLASDIGVAKGQATCSNHGSPSRSDD